MPIRVLASVIQRDHRLLVWRRELSAPPLPPNHRRYLAFRRDGGGKGGG
jgi:hypothetical protein